MFIKSFGLAVIGLTTLGIFSAAQADTINCPHPEIRSEVTTQLNGGWWDIPATGSLQGTAIVTTPNGRQLLQCQYGAAGNIHLNVQQGQSCRTVDRGFVCVSDSAAVSSGDMFIAESYRGDLDENSRGSQRDDIWYSVERDGRYLVPVNGAQFAVGNGSYRDRRGCARADYSTGKASLARFEMSSICVRTNGGHFAIVQMLGLIGQNGVNGVSLRYELWE